MSKSMTVECSLCSRAYNGTANRYPNADGTEPPRATYGQYNGTNWVGMVLLPQSFKGKRVKKIILSLTATRAGAAYEKSVHVWSSNYETFFAEGKGEIYPKEDLGGFSGTFYDNEETTTITATKKMQEYLKAGNRMLILYDQNARADNYCRFSRIVMTIIWEDASLITHYDQNGFPQKAYVHYKTVIKDPYHQKPDIILESGRCKVWYYKDSKWNYCSSDK